MSSLVSARLACGEQPPTSRRSWRTPAASSLKIYKLNALTIGDHTIHNGRLAVGDERAERALSAAGTTAQQPQVSVMQSHVTDVNNSRTGTNVRSVSAARLEGAAHMHPMCQPRAVQRVMFTLQRSRSSAASDARGAKAELLSTKQCGTRPNLRRVATGSLSLPIQ